MVKPSDYLIVCHFVIFVFSSFCVFIIFVLLRYRILYRFSIDSASRKLLEFDEDLTERTALISSMGQSIERDFNASVEEWNNKMQSMQSVFQSEVRKNAKWTFTLCDHMMPLISSQNNSNTTAIGSISKIGSAVIADADWMDNGSLVLYIEAPAIESIINSMNDNHHEEDHEDSKQNGSDEMEVNQTPNEMVLKQYTLRYRYVSKTDNIQSHKLSKIDLNTNHDDDSKEQYENTMDSGVDSTDRALVSDLEEREQKCWRTQPWTEVTFDNDSQYLSTIPLKIRPYLVDESLLNDVQGPYRFVYLCQFMEIEIQICCQFQVLPQRMTFWSPYSEVYRVNEGNIVVDDRLRAESTGTIEVGSMEEEQEFEEQKVEDLRHSAAGMDSVDGVVDANRLIQRQISSQIGNRNRDRNMDRNQNQEHDHDRNAMVELINETHQLPHHSTESYSYSSSALSVIWAQRHDVDPLAEDVQIGDVFLLRSLVRAWRHDQEQDKWRGRGKGNLCVYKNSVLGEVRIVFKDIKHDNKVRLLQRICGHNNGVEDRIRCEYHTNGTQHEVEWRNHDYSMNANNPLYGLWRLSFIDEPSKAKDLVAIFNEESRQSGMRQQVDRL